MEIFYVFVGLISLVIGMFAAQTYFSVRPYQRGFIDIAVAILNLMLSLICLSAFIISSVY